MAWENLPVESEGTTTDTSQTNGDVNAGPTNDTLDSGSPTVDTPDESGEGFSKETAERLVTEAEQLVNTVDDAIRKIAAERDLKDLWGNVDPRLAVVGYVGYMTLQFGVEETAEKLGIPLPVLQKISSWLKYLDEAGKLAGEVPNVVKIAVLSWLARTLGRAEFERQVKKPGSFAKAPKSWAHVGAALAGRGAPAWLAESVAQRGNLIVAVLTAYFQRHQIYGAGKAWWDANKARIEDVRKEFDEDIYDAGDKSDPTALWINPETGEVSTEPKEGFERDRSTGRLLNRGGSISRDLMKAKYNRMMRVKRRYA